MKVLCTIVFLIGLYMLVTYWGAITPPVLSGIAFMLIGASVFVSKK